MNFFKKLFGKAEDTAHDVADTTTHMAAEAEHQLEESTEEAREAMHDAAEGTIAEDTVDSVLGEDDTR